MRRALVWLVAAPLAAAATVAAHALDYRIVVPDADARHALLATTGHGYEQALPLVFGLAGAAVLVALVAGARELRAAAPRPAALPFVLLPPLTFTLQEHLERYLHDGAAPWHAVTEPTFLPGLLLTLPFGAAAYLAARLLLRIARVVAVALGEQRPRLSCVSPPRVPYGATLAPISVLASGRSTRGPPRVR